MHTHFFGESPKKKEEEEKKKKWFIYKFFQAWSIVLSYIFSYNSK